MIVRITKTLCDQFFPDMAAGWPLHHNDNQKEPNMAEEEIKDPMANMAYALLKNSEALQALASCIETHHRVLSDHENRIQNLEEILGE